MAAANALITLAELKTYLGLTSSSQDARLDALIDAVSAAIEQYCQNPLIIQTGLAEFYEETPNRSPRLYLKHYPVVQVTDIRDEADFLIPLTEVNVRREWGELYRAGGWPRPQDANGNPARWRVTYDAGRFATVALVPADLKLAAKKWVSLARELVTPGVQSKSMGQISVTFADLASLFEDGPPLEVAQLLGPYKSRPV